MSDEITLNFLASSLKLQNFSISISQNSQGSDLISLIKQHTGENCIKLVHKGRTIFPDTLLKDQGLSSSSKIIISKDVPKAFQPPPAEKKPQEKSPDPPQPQSDIPQPAAKGPKALEIQIHESIISNLYTWGQNSFGKLGLSTLEDSFFPHPILMPSIQFSQVSCGASLTVALSSTGEIYNWGRLLYPKGSNPNFKNQMFPCLVKELKEIRFCKVTAGNNHVLALDNRGDVWAWGEGICGQLGHGTMDNEFYPKRIESLAGFRIVDIAAGAAHSAAVTKTCNCIVWGKNSAKQLGTGDNKERILPTVVLSLKADKVKCGSFHTLWLNNKSLYISGNNNKTALIHENCQMFEAGGLNTLILDSKGELLIYDEELKTTSETFLDIKQIVSNGTDSLILTNNGDLFAKGSNKHGELGIGNKSSKFTWVPVYLPFKVQSISCGSSHVGGIIEPTSLSYQIMQNKSLLSDTPIYCPDGICQAHSLLLNSHTNASMLFSQTSSGYSSELPMQLTEQLINWLYCQQLNIDLTQDQLNILYQFSIQHSLTHLAELTKFELDIKTADLQYLMYLPELTAEKLIEEMTANELKLKQEREIKEKMINEEAKSENNPMDIDENIGPDREEIVPDQTEPVVAEDPGERRRKILEALEKRSNPN